MSEDLSLVNIYRYCPKCDRFSLSKDLNHKCPGPKSLLELLGSADSSAKLFENVLSESEEEKVIRNIDVASTNWTTSSQNIRKQEFGPEINFEKGVIEDYEVYTGLPPSVLPVVSALGKLTADFAPSRLRILEYSEKIGENWIDSKFHDHSKLFCDRMVLTALQCDISARFQCSTESEIEFHLPARSSLIVRGNLSFKRLLVRSTGNLTRCILLIFNELKPELVTEKILRFQNAYKGVAIARYRKLGDLVPNETPPAFLNRLVDHHISLNELKSLLANNYQLDIDHLELREHYRSVNWQSDKNFLIQSGDEEFWAKLTVQSAVFNDKLIGRILELQNCVSEQLEVPAPILTKTDAMYVSFKKSRIHYLWLMPFDNHIALSGCPEIPVDRGLRLKLGALLRRFHECSSRCILKSEFVTDLELHYLTEGSFRRDKDVMLKRLPTIADSYHRSMLLTCIELVDKLDFASYPKVIGHLAFCPDTVHLRSAEKTRSDLEDLSVGHFAHVRYTCKITDLVICAIRFHDYSKMDDDQDSRDSDSIVDYIGDFIEGYGLGNLDKLNEEIIYDLLFVLMTNYLLDCVENSLALNIEENRDEVARSASRALNHRFKCFEEMYKDKDLKDKIKEKISKLH